MAAAVAAVSGTTVAVSGEDMTAAPGSPSEGCDVNTDDDDDDGEEEKEEKRVWTIKSIAWERCWATCSSSTCFAFAAVLSLGTSIGCSTFSVDNDDGDDDDDDDEDKVTSPCKASITAFMPLGRGRGDVTAASASTLGTIGAPAAKHDCGPMESKDV